MVGEKNTNIHTKMEKTVQTLWTGHKSLVRDSFGWLEPQYHLMAWALSCLMLRESYDDVELYTDSEGAAVLIDRLRLPYTQVRVCYDRLDIPEPHWAYAKMMTYSMQDTPFIHVDGDIFVPRRLAADIGSCGLIAQNEEEGTAYYKNIMDGLDTRDMVMPSCLHEELARQSIGSYNAGVLGGSDTGFIQRYCETAFRIIRDNGLDRADSGRLNGNYNLMFEQVLFYAMVKAERRKVTTLFAGRTCDNGYTYGEFCDFLNISRRPLLHLLGGHKRNAKACALLARTLLGRYPEYFWRIAEMFGGRHPRLSGMPVAEADRLSAVRCVASYADWLEERKREWDTVERDRLIRQEELSARVVEFFNIGEERRDGCVLAVNPYMRIFSIPERWHTEARALLISSLCGHWTCGMRDIACVPTVTGKEYREIVLNDLCFNILSLLRREQTWRELRKGIMACVADRLKMDATYVDGCVRDAMERLMMEGAVMWRKR